MNFDPSQHFDPRGFAGDAPASILPTAPTNDGLVQLAGNELAQFDISVVNGQAVSMKVQLFNYFKTISNIVDANLMNGINPFTGQDVAAADLKSLTYWKHDGSLVSNEATPLPVTISCKQTPYRALLESSSRTPFQIEKLRLTVTNDAQIDNEIFMVENTWLGKVDRNSINPRTYFNPNQFQSKIIDIPLKYVINFERGLELIVNAGETINLSFFVSSYRKHALK